jgi:hypothetical protein
VGASLRSRQFSIRFAAADDSDIVLNYPLGDQPSTLGFGTRLAKRSFPELMASLIASDNSIGKESFLRYPPPPFDRNFVRGERRRTDMNEDWLPNLQELVSGNVQVYIDLTGDLDHKVVYHLYKPRDQHGDTDFCAT